MQCNPWFFVHGNRRRAKSQLRNVNSKYKTASAQAKGLGRCGTGRGERYVETDYGSGLAVFVCMRSDRRRVEGPGPCGGRQRAFRRCGASETGGWQLCHAGDCGKQRG